MTQTPTNAQIARQNADHDHQQRADIQLGEQHQASDSGVIAHRQTAEQQVVQRWEQIRDELHPAGEGRQHRQNRQGRIGNRPPLQHPSGAFQARFTRAERLFGHFDHANGLLGHLT
jgi:hypothetical protein